ncbi:rubrerythrin family protein [Romboutsia sedimentorum]|uniref:Rubrerythrin family protein n=1 Tax=Romboutsia sedimentorum TaxID=1368474 RepID=A0ABT7E808_9FIRM|nr:rubrerythrin family protein [Romboutsia sedimentorum]MDK2563022.1 rubrerythrin family protein [Romboutsia sedimentorum]MDK2586257.1 rubrerythrin family protein [Romboutsia sedimentorum]
MNSLKDSKTKLNLMRAFAGESQARNRYTFGASQAKNKKLALIEQAFIYTADQEKAHAKVFYDHLKELSGETIHIDGGYPVEIYDDIIQTLRAAQQDEYKEWEEVYKSFANTAKEEGFVSVANSFEKIAEIEKTHGDRFGDFAQKLESNMLFKSVEEEQWICLNCGHIHSGKEAPNNCPVCSHPQGYFILYSKSPFEN